MKRTPTPKTAPAASPEQDRRRGLLVGVHTGDSLGATFEFQSRTAVQARTFANPDGWAMVGGGPFAWRPGQPTDDTGLTIAVAQGHLDPGPRTREDVWWRMQDWYDGALLGDGHPKDIGGATNRALSTGRPDPAALGNGALMRCAPTALLDDRDERMRLTAVIARLTHPHPWSVAACVAYNEIAHALICGADVDEAIEAGVHSADATAPEVGDAIHFAARHGDTDHQLTDDAAGYVVDSLILAVAALVKADRFDAGLVWVIRFGRDTDTNGAIAGGLLGARFGASAIPARWTDRLEWGAWLSDVADTLH